VLVGDFFGMSLQKPEIQKSRNLEFFILAYTLKHKDAYFNKCTLYPALQQMTFSENYIGISLSKLARLRFLEQNIRGNYRMTNQRFQFIIEINPPLAQEIKTQANMDIINWQKSTF